MTAEERERLMRITELASEMVGLIQESDDLKFRFGSLFVDEGVWSVGRDMVAAIAEAHGREPVWSVRPNASSHPIALTVEAGGVRYQSIHEVAVARSLGCPARVIRQLYGDIDDEKTPAVAAAEAQ